MNVIDGQFPAPVMNGSGGDLVGIQASRMTTYLHKVPFIINIFYYNHLPPQGAFLLFILLTIDQSF